MTGKLTEEVRNGENYDRKADRGGSEWRKL